MATHGASRGHIRSGWVGWVYFAGTVLVLIGAVQFINGLFALSRSGTTFITPSGMSVQLSYAGVGWSFLIMGIVLAASGGGVLAGRTWARTVAIILAAASLVANLMVFAAYPLWSALVIVLDVVVIYALAVHGGEVRRRS
jgi:hypothetical protein